MKWIGNTKTFRGCVRRAGKNGEMPKDDRHKVYISRKQGQTRMWKSKKKILID